MSAITPTSVPLLRRAWVRWTIAIVIAVLLVVAPLILPKFTNQSLAHMVVFAVASLGLNVVMGYGGQVSLGHIFFLGLGAYATAWTINNVPAGGWETVIAFFLAAVLSGIVGLVVALAAARLRGLAIAMVTIALPIVGVPLAKRLSDITGGSPGISSDFSTAPAWTGLYDDQWQYYIVVVLGVIVFLLAWSFLRSKYGRALGAVKANEAVASSLGISPYRYKVLAFTVSAIIAGIAGFLYIATYQFTSPDTMGFNNSITLIAATIVGGSGRILGSVLAGIYYVLVPQAANAVDSDLTAIIQGVVLLVILFVLPGGLASLPHVIRRLTRKRRTKDPDDRSVASSANPESKPSAE